MVAQRDLGGAQLFGHAVQDAAAQAAAQAAHGLALRDHALDDAVGVLRFDVKGHAQFAQVIGQDVRWKAGLLLVQVDGDQAEVDGRALLQLEQNVEHGVAVFAAGDADHDLVAFLDHVEVHDGAADFAAQALFELHVLALDLQVFGQRLAQRRGGRFFGFNPDGAHAEASLFHSLFMVFTTVLFLRESLLRSRQKFPAWQSSPAHPAHRAIASGGARVCQSGSRAGSCVPSCIR